MNLALLLITTAVAWAQNPPPPPAPQQPPAGQQPPVPQQPPKPAWQDFCCYEKGRTEKDGLVTIVYEISHVPNPPAHAQGLEEFQRMLQPYLTPKGRIENSNRLSALVVTDAKENIGHLEKMLQLLHTADQPIMIEAKVVELRWDKDLQIGVEGDLNAANALFTSRPTSEGFLKDVRVNLDPTSALGPTPFQGSTFRFANTSAHRGSYGGLLRAFVERGKAQILSQPRILVRTDETATIFSGDEVPYPASVTTQPVGGAITQFTYKNAGVKLEVKPHVAAPGHVSLRLRPEVTTIFGFIEVVPGTQAPQFTVRNVSTELLVRDQEEVVIGGLFRRDRTTIRRGLPFLADIPLIGVLFGKYEETEIVQEILFFIKPTIIKSEREMPRGDIRPDR